MHLLNAYVFLIATVPLRFPGNAYIQVILIHPSEAIDFLRRVTSSKLSPGLYFRGIFQDEKIVEDKECNVWLLSLANATKEQLKNNYCDFTVPKHKEPWICEKPKLLECSDIKYYKVLRTNDASSLLQNSGLFKP